MAKSRLEDYRGAIVDVNKGINIDPENAYFYYLRGFSKVKLGEKDSGCLDLSKAGEMGYGDAYDYIKNLCQ